jgi:hypothetical protein
MSGQAKRTRSYRRWREQALGLLGRMHVTRSGEVPGAWEWGTPCSAGMSYPTADRDACAAAIAFACAGIRSGFDVGFVRTYAERIVAIGDGNNLVVGADLAEFRGREVAAAWLRRNAPRLRARARTAMRLLDTLDGRCPWGPGAPAQSDACGRCDGSGRSAVHPEVLAMAAEDMELGPMHNQLLRGAVDGDGTISCGRCAGTGRNLNGILPEVVESSARSWHVATADIEPCNNNAV